jgi:hypothetical protein
MAYDRQAQHPEKYDDDLLAVTLAGTEPGRKRLQYLRANWLSNTVFETYDDIIDAACDAWNKLTEAPDVIKSIGRRQWAHIGHS